MFTGQTNQVGNQIRGVKREQHRMRVGTGVNANMESIFKISARY